MHVTAADPSAGALRALQKADALPAAGFPIDGHGHPWRHTQRVKRKQMALLSLYIL